VGGQELIAQVSLTRVDDLDGLRLVFAARGSGGKLRAELCAGAPEFLAGRAVGGEAVAEFRRRAEPGFRGLRLDASRGQKRDFRCQFLIGFFRGRHRQSLAGNLLLPES
jgi:hypothetical protein